MILFNKNCTSVGKLPCGCENSSPTLVAAGGDLWVLPRGAMPPPLTYELKDCCGNDLGGFPMNVGGIPSYLNSSFSFNISSLTNNSGFFACKSCDGVTQTTNVWYRGDFASDLDFITTVCDDIALILGIANYTIDQYTITFTWNGPANDCLCSTNIFVKNLDDVNDLPVCTAFSNAYTYKLKGKANCYNKTFYTNILELRVYDMCIKEVVQPECIDENIPYVSIAFPHKLNSCVRIYSNSDCSQEIQVSPSIQSYVSNGAPISGYLGNRVLCNTFFIQARNKGETWTAFRLYGTILNPQIKVENKVFRTPRGEIKELYATQETEWQFYTDFLDVYTHKFISQVLVKDFVYIEGVFDYPFQTDIKRLTMSSGYDVEYDPFYIGGGRLGRAKFTMLEYNYLNTNNYIQ